MDSVMGSVIIGTSGWSYKHWRGVFYPDNLASGKWLSYYSQHFKSVEINMTFYRTPNEKTIKGWLSKSTAGFIFTIKASRYITHVRMLEDIEESVDKLYSMAKGFDEKGGCILFQLPPSFHQCDDNMQRVDGLLKLLDRRYDHAIEFRHRSWWNDECYELLRGRAAFCSVDGLGMPTDLVVTDEILYLRFHGKRYDSLYADDELREYAVRIKSTTVDHGIKRIYIYFNNDMNGYAVLNARTLKEILLDSVWNP
jgi:uncharacterized protein YecE (DUF72 family)